MQHLPLPPPLVPHTHIRTRLSGQYWGLVGRSDLTRVQCRARVDACNQSSAAGTVTHGSYADE